MLKNLKEEDKELKRRLGKIHNPLYPPYLKGDSEGENVAILMEW
jgi:hypothetical protein